VPSSGAPVSTRAASPKSWRPRETR